MANATLSALLQTPAPPAGFLNWFTENEVRAALDEGRTGRHEPAVRAWLHAKERQRQHLEAAAAFATTAHLNERRAMWAATLVAAMVFVDFLLRRLL